MKYLFLVLFVILVSCNNQIKTELTPDQIEKDSEAIKTLLHKQAEDWTNASIEAFMNGYEKTPNLLFVGKNGITKGWQQTLERYKSNYPSKDHTGQLSFDILEIQPINSESYILVGEFHLKRNVGNADGIFTLVFKKVNNEWKVISDHTTAYDDEQS